MRVVLPEGRQDQGQKGGCPHGRKAHPKAAGIRVLQACQLNIQFLFPIQNFLGCRQIRSARVGGQVTPPHPAKKRQSVLVFQLLQKMAEGRLGNVQFLRSPADIPGMGDGGDIGPIPENPNAGSRKKIGATS